jgi:acylphosphatase
MTTERIRRHVIVCGRVQGVFFRDSLRQQALHYGVAGWVRNRPDGAVEAIFEGAPGPVGRLVEFSRTGPPHARVDRVEVNEEPPEGLTGFTIQ